MSSYGAIFNNITLTRKIHVNKNATDAPQNPHKITNEILLYVVRNVIQVSEY